MGNLRERLDDWTSAMRYHLREHEHLYSYQVDVARLLFKEVLANVPGTLPSDPTTATVNDPGFPDYHRVVQAALIGLVCCERAGKPQVGYMIADYLTACSRHFAKPPPEVSDYDRGYADGKTVAYPLGYDKGTQDATDRGYRKGYADGHTVGESKGYMRGFQEGQAAHKENCGLKEGPYKVRP